ncbi:MAG TPA: HlyD family secretion protein, partial [Asticcacaulis sp.]|nr:HlyD family secretion protein [Asticcacaulis sp.]
MTHPNLYRAFALTALGSALALTGCGDKPGKTAPEAHGAAAEEFERGPHRGRMLRDGDFAIEMTIFEDGVEPEFHVYAYNKDKPVDPKNVQMSVT